MKWRHFGECSGILRAHVLLLNICWAPSFLFTQSHASQRFCACIVVRDTFTYSRVFTKQNMFSTINTLSKADVLFEYYLRRRRADFLCVCVQEYALKDVGRRCSIYLFSLWESLAMGSNAPVTQYQLNQYLCYIKKWKPGPVLQKTSLLPKCSNECMINRI